MSREWSCKRIYEQIIPLNSMQMATLQTDWKEKGLRIHSCSAHPYSVASNHENKNLWEAIQCRILTANGNLASLWTHLNSLRSDTNRRVIIRTVMLVYMEGVILEGYRGWTGRSVSRRLKIPLQGETRWKSRNEAQ